jgi:hypothetical protein
MQMYGCLLVEMVNRVVAKPGDDESVEAGEGVSRWLIALWQNRMSNGWSVGYS